MKRVMPYIVTRRLSTHTIFIAAFGWRCRYPPATCTTSVVVPVIPCNMAEGIRGVSVLIYFLPYFDIWFVWRSEETGRPRQI